MCQAVGLELHQVIDEAEQFTGRSLRIKLYSVNHDGVIHSDVELFMPPIGKAAVQSIETDDEICAEDG